VQKKRLVVKRAGWTEREASQDMRHEYHHSSHVKEKSTKKLQSEPTATATRPMKTYEYSDGTMDGERERRAVSPSEPMWSATTVDVEATQRWSIAEKGVRSIYSRWWM